MIRTYVDTGVLIAVARGKSGDPLFENAMRIIDDPQREFVGSVFLRLELLPKPTFNGFPQEAEIYKAFLGSCVDDASGSASLLEDALDEATRHGLGAVDAMHIVAAHSLRADEFVTSEGPSKSVHRTRRLSVVTVATKP